MYFPGNNWMPSKTITAKTVSNWNKDDNRTWFKTQKQNKKYCQLFLFDPHPIYTCKYINKKQCLEMPPSSIKIRASNYFSAILQLLIVTISVHCVFVNKAVWNLCPDMMAFRPGVSCLTLRSLKHESPKTPNALRFLAWSRYFGKCIRIHITDHPKFAENTAFS